MHERSAGAWFHYAPVNSVMARYMQDIPLNQPMDVVSDIMENFIYRNRYFRTDWNGEPVYLSTDSAEGGHRYFKWSYVNGVVHIEAWMKGTFGGEDDLNGGGKKKAYRDSLEQLIMKLQNPPGDEYSASFSNGEQPAYVQSQSTYASPQTQNSYNVQQPAYTPPQNTQQPTYTRQWMTGVHRGKAYIPTGNPNMTIPGNPNAPISANNPNEVSSAYNFAIVALVLAFVFPFIGLILGIVGRKKCNAAMPSDTTGKAKKGKTMCTIAMVVPIIYMACSMIGSVLMSFLAVYNMY